jgi:hypothetical protein
MEQLQEAMDPLLEAAPVHQHPLCFFQDCCSLALYFLVVVVPDLLGAFQVHCRQLADFAVTQDSSCCHQHFTSQLVAVTISQLKDFTHWYKFFRGSATT